MKKTVTLIIASLIAISSYGQSAVSFVNISADPVYYSLGGAALTADANAFSVSTNISAVALGDDHMAASASYGSWQPQGVNSSLASISGFGLIGGKLGVGLNAKYMMYPSYSTVTEGGFPAGEFTPEDLSMELGLSYKIIKGLSAGVNVRYIMSKLAKEADGSAVSADISLSYRVAGIRVAAAVTNLGSKIDYGYRPYTLPAMAKLGVGYVYDIQNSSVGVHLEGDYIIYNGSVMCGLGAEYKFKELVSARVGYHYGSKAADAILSYFSAGLGVKLLGVTLDAAYLVGMSESPLNNTWMVSLGYRF